MEIKMTTTDTPCTDEILMQCPAHLQEVALANLSQELERENTDLRTQLKKFLPIVENAITDIAKCRKGISRLRSQSDPASVSSSITQNLTK